jgi:hypothetical protein
MKKYDPMPSPNRKNQTDVTTALLNQIALAEHLYQCRNIYQRPPPPVPAQGLIDPHHLVVSVKIITIDGLVPNLDSILPSLFQHGVKYGYSHRQYHLALSVLLLNHRLYEALHKFHQCDLHTVIEVLYYLMTPTYSANQANIFISSLERNTTHTLPESFTVANDRLQPFCRHLPAIMKPYIMAYIQHIIIMTLSTDAARPRIAEARRMCFQQGLALDPVCLLLYGHEIECQHAATNVHSLQYENPRLHHALLTLGRPLDLRPENPLHPHYLPGHLSHIFLPLTANNKNQRNMLPSRRRDDKTSQEATTTCLSQDNGSSTQQIMDLMPPTPDSTNDFRAGRTLDTGYRLETATSAT